MVHQEFHAINVSLTSTVYNDDFSITKLYIAPAIFQDKNMLLSALFPAAPPALLQSRADVRNSLLPYFLNGHCHDVDFAASSPEMQNF